MKIITKAYRALCDGCSNKKIEIRVPNEEATTLGLVKDPYENNKQCLSMGCSLPKENQIQEGKEEETKEVAEQVIVEEANEEEVVGEEETPDNDVAKEGQEPSSNNSDSEEEQKAAASQK